MNTESFEPPSGSAPNPGQNVKNTTCADLQDPRARALHVASEHLRHAGLSHERACALQAQGDHLQACAQSRMTQVFLSNAAYHLARHTGTSWPG